MHYACAKVMGRVASPKCDLCGKSKMKRLYTRVGNTYIGAGWVCSCALGSAYIERDSKGWETLV